MLVEWISTEENVDRARSRGVVPSYYRFPLIFNLVSVFNFPHCPAAGSRAYSRVADGEDHYSSDAAAPNLLTKKSIERANP